MQTDNLHEMSKPIFWEIKNISKCRLLKFLPSMQSVNLEIDFQMTLWLSIIVSTEDP